MLGVLVRYCCENICRCRSTGAELDAINDVDASLPLPAMTDFAFLPTLSNFDVERAAHVSLLDVHALLA